MPPIAPSSVDPATAADTAGVDSADSVEGDAGSPIDPRLAALGLTPDAPSEPLVPVAPTAGRKPTAPLAEAAAAALAAAPQPAQFGPAVAAQPRPEPGLSDRIPGSYVPPMVGPEPSAWTLQPSSAGSVARSVGSSLSVSVGAMPVSPVSHDSPADAPHESPWSGWPPAPPEQTGPALAPVPEPAGSEPEPEPGPAAIPSAMAPWATPTAAAEVVMPSPAVSVVDATNQQTSDVLARKETTQELVAFGLVVAGAGSGIASLFLPWAGSVGIGIGSTGSPPPNDWGWDMPAAIPLFLLSALVLGTASGSDRAQVRLPNFATLIARVTDLVLPMILGGLYLGVFLLYLTLPWGCGGGVFGILLGSGLLIAGGVVTLFFPPDAASGTAGSGGSRS